MNSPSKRNFLPPSARLAAVKAAQDDYVRETSITTMKSPMPWVERTLWRIAAFCVGHAIQLRQKRIERISQKPTGLFASQKEYEKFLNGLMGRIQNGNAK
jgi:hypothetical protein